MTENTPQNTDPQEYRGGAPEPADAKGGVGEFTQEGIVPDSASDDAPPPDSSGEQDMKNAALGDFPEDPESRIDLSAGDNADATRDGHSGGARGSEAGLGRHEPDMDVQEEDVANQ